MRKKLATDNSLFKIGLNIRQARRKRELTLSDLAQHTGLSKGLLSKIENFRTLPSLPVLAAIARSLNLKLENLVEGIGVAAKTAGQFVGVADRLPFKREKARGFHYAALIAQTLGNIGFESVVLTLKPGAKREPVSTDGHEFIFMLKGEVMFRVGSEAIKLSKGDAYYFDGRLPHTPQNLTNSSAELLAIYLLKQNNPKGNHED